MLHLTTAALGLLAVAGSVAAEADVTTPAQYSIEFDIRHTRGVRVSSQRPATSKQGRWSNQDEHRRYRQEKLDSLSSSSLAIEGCFQTDFYANANIGNSTFQLILDTGSTTMAVAGQSCQETDSSGQTPTGPCGVDEYTPTGNSVGSVKANYGIGSLQGPIYNGDVTVGSTPTVNMDFVVVTASTDFFTDDSCTGNNVDAPVYDGILGLAYSKLAYQGTDSWFDKLLSTTNAASANQAFTMSFTESSGVMNIGTGSSDDSITRYMAVTPTGYYSGLMTQISIGGTAVSGVTQSAIGGFVVDSGTNSIVLPTNVYRAVVSAITKSSGWEQSGLSSRFFSSSSCATPKNANTINNILPELTVTVVTPQNTLIDVTIQAYNGYITPFNSTPTTELWCPGLADGGAVDSSSESNTILGLPFMIQFETTFDRANSRVGFNPTQCADCQTGSTAGYNGTFTPYSQTTGGSPGSQLGSPVIAALLSIVACIVITQAHWTG